MLPHDWADWRGQQITNLVRAQLQKCKATIPGMQVSAAVFPGSEELAYAGRLGGLAS